MTPLDAELRIGPEPWMERAKCKGRPTQNYDIDHLPSPLLAHGSEHRIAARNACKGCPVFANCAWYAYRFRTVGCVMAGIPIKIQRNEMQFMRLLEIAARAGIEDARKELSKSVA